MGTRKGGLTAYIEKRFYQYEKIKLAVWEARHDSGANKTGGNGSGHAFVSDPTANAAMRESMPLYAVTIEIGKNEVETVKQPEKWLKVIEATYKRYKGGPIEQLLKRRYAGESHTQICMELCISQNVYYCMLREVSRFSLACACQEGLVRVF